MKRSQINANIAQAEEDFAKVGFALPSFASWTLEDWEKQGDAARYLIEAGHGWDITDFGGDEFDAKGLLLFTLRNGLLREAAGNKPYAEKIMITRKDQLTPMHRHNIKVEDIIVRNSLVPGAQLAVKVLGSNPEGKLSRTGKVRVFLDGIAGEVDPGTVIRLSPGESITLFPDTFHSFWGDGGDMVVGEVSSVNDDKSDNVFAEPLARFSPVEEDEAIYRPLVNDHPDSAGGY
ncbi:D-lyxose/D-mannose family sugar isomerase [Palleronia sp.]|uniref:D-lyxose/D-mannose family sugar isomerase n=1 Tax=Palleronia sp. TaxID=1940284 RepID=UPI0035C7CCE0